jgi:hypothetical protein
MLYKAIFLATCLATELSLPIWSAQERAPDLSELRTVQGAVLDAPETAHAPTVVYLYDNRTQSVRTYFADKSNHYRFCGLYPLDDYQIYATRGALTSRTYSISRHDGRRDFVVNLRIRNGTGNQSNVAAKRESITEERTR